MSCFSVRNDAGFSRWFADDCSVGVREKIVILRGILEGLGSKSSLRLEPGDYSVCVCVSACV